MVYVKKKIGLIHNMNQYEFHIDMNIRNMKDQKMTQLIQCSHLLNKIIHSNYLLLLCCHLFVKQETIC